jgi:hypothetical protein
MTATLPGSDTDSVRRLAKREMSPAMKKKGGDTTERVAACGAFGARVSLLEGEQIGHQIVDLLLA